MKEVEVVETKTIESEVVEEVEEAVETESQAQVVEKKEPVKAEESEVKEPVKENNWREEIIKTSGLEGDDLDALKKRLDRYASPAAMAKGLVELNKKISSGEYKIPAPEDPEALARWRKENGIPDKPDGYNLELADGLVIGELDKPLVEGFLEVAHSKNLDNSVVKEVLSWYKSQEQAMIDADIKQLNTLKDTAISTLKEEWGSEFEGNMTAVTSLHTKLYGEELGSQLAKAILPDGTPLGSHPDFLRAQDALSRELNIGDNIVPGAINKMEAIASEKAEIEAKMGTKNYTQADRSRYFELTEAEQKLSSRG